MWFTLNASPNDRLIFVAKLVNIATLIRAVKKATAFDIGTHCCFLSDKHLKKIYNFLFSKYLFCVSKISHFC